MLSDRTPIGLIVGLGNPGAEYERTRHNIGFMVVDHLATAWGIKLAPERRFQGIYGEGRSNHHHDKLRLLKPTTFMNASGKSVRACCDWYKIDPQSILVIYDDMDLPLGKIRLRIAGSAGGHNGMKSIIAHLGTQEFPRLRLGIGRAGELNSAANPNTVSHVLGNFSAAENQLLPELMQLSESAIASINTAGIAKAMSTYNSRSVSIGSI